MAVTGGLTFGHIEGRVGKRFRSGTGPGLWIGRGFLSGDRNSPSVANARDDDGNEHDGLSSETEIAAPQRIAYTGN